MIGRRELGATRRELACRRTLSAARGLDDRGAIAFEGSPRQLESSMSPIFADTPPDLFAPSALAVKPFLLFG